jgi:HEAT repeat protein
VIGTIILLSFVVFRFRKNLWQEIKKWSVDGISIWILSLKRAPEAKNITNSSGEEKETRELAMRAIRQLNVPVSSHTAKLLTQKILGIRSLAFWDQISNKGLYGNDIRVLAENPLFLEALICVFKKKNGNLPANIGALMDSLLLELWSKEKLQSARWVSLEHAKKSLSGMIYGDFPASIYPVDGEYFDQFNNRWENLIANMGKTQRASMVARLLLVPITLTLFPFQVLGSLFRRLLDALNAHQNYQKITSFFGQYNWLRKSQIKQGILILGLAQKAGLLHVDYESKKITFSHQIWVDYFYALSYVRGAKNEAAAAIPMRGYSESWNRLASSYDRVVVMISGLIGQPGKLVDRLAELDPFVAAQCIVSDIPGVSANTRQRVYMRLRQNMLAVLSGGEDRSYDCAKFLRALNPNPNVIPDILETIRRLGPYEFIKMKLVKIIAEFDEDAVNPLMDNLAANSDIRIYLLTALAFSASPRAIPVLQEALKDSEASIKIRATAVLAIVYNDTEAVNAMVRYLFAENNQDEDGKYAWWHNIAPMQAVSFPFAIQVMINHVERFTSAAHGRIESSREWHFGKEKFLEIIRDCEADGSVEDLLIDTLLSARNHEIIMTMVEALGAMKAKNLYYRFIELIQEDPSDELRLAIITAFGQMQEQRALGFLTEQADTFNLKIAGKAIQALGKLGSVEAVDQLERKLDQTGVAIEHPDLEDAGYPIAYLAVEALEQIGHFKSGSLLNEAKEAEVVTEKRGYALDLAVKWCAAHVDSPEKLGWGNTTLGKECQNYLEYRLNTRESQRWFYEWSESRKKAN